MQNNYVDLGLVNNVAVMKKPGQTENFLMVGVSPSSGRWARVITRGAAQALWFHLTHILYPRAADTLTPRAATAVLRKADAPTVTSFFEVRNQEDHQRVQIHGMGGVEEWVILVSYDDGHELWASLENMLGTG
jgi:hypothetical protein